MPCSLNRYYVPFLVTLLGPLLATTPAHTQSITPADTATAIQQTGNQYQIDGGNLSGDSATLFHSFDQFGLLTGESAQFSNPVTVENIVGRVMGGDASIIDGLLAVDGNANLYLLNPAGIFFGENTQLNLGGSFSASTATGLTFGNELLDALGSNDYGQLTGAPTGYVFGTETGAIVNAGDLAVTLGQSLTLLGGQVINTGQLSAPGGEVLVMAVPGENRVRLSQNGSLLGLELETLPGTAPTSAFTAATVPALLTGAGALGMATDITVNPDGTVSLSGSSLQIPTDPGTAIVSGQLEADSGNIGVLAEQIALVGADVDASGDAGGGTVLIGGDELGNGTVPNAAATIIDENSVVQADARDTGNGGKIVAWGTNLLQSAGQLFARGGGNGGDGGFIETSSLGQLEVSTTPDVSTANGTGGLWLLDPANISIVEGNGATNISETSPFISNTTDALLGVGLITQALQNGNTVKIEATGTAPGDGNITLTTPLDFQGTFDPDNPDGSSLNLIANGEIRIQGAILNGEEFDFGGVSSLLNLTLQANDQITIEGVISSTGGDISITSSQNNVIVNNEIRTGGGKLAIDAPQGGITVSSVIHTELPPSGLDLVDSLPPGGASISNLPSDSGVSLSAQNAIQVNNIIAKGESFDPFSFELDPFSFSTISGAPVVINSQTSIQVGDIITAGVEAGAVTLTATGNIEFNSIDASSKSRTLDLISGARGDIGGTVTITSTEGMIRGTGTTLSFPDTTIITDGESWDGNITITHGGGNSIPFRVGNTAVNGTVGAISSGDVTLNSEEFTGDEARRNLVGDIVLPGTIEFSTSDIAIQDSSGQIIGQTSRVTADELTGRIPDLSLNIDIDPETGEVTDLRTGNVIGEAINAPNNEPGLQELTANNTIQLEARELPVELRIIDSSTDTEIGQTIEVTENLITREIAGSADDTILGTITNPSTGALTDIEISTTTGLVIDSATGNTIGQVTDIAGLTNLAAGQNLGIAFSEPLPSTEELPGETRPEIPPEADELAASCISDCRQSGPSEGGGGQSPASAPNVLPAPEIALQNFERRLTTEYSDHLGLGADDSGSGIEITGAESVDAADLPAAQAKLRQVQGQTGKRPALIYAVFGSAAEDTDNVLQRNVPSDPLELLLITADGDPQYIRLGATRGKVLELAHRFRRQIISPSRVGTQTYLPVAQELYQLLIAPLESELAAQEIDTISFVTDAGLRSVPLAALHDGESFLVENYNVGLMPSLSLTDLTYQDIRNVGALVAGTSVFADQVPLPSVPVELDAISTQWNSALLQGDTFNLNKLQGERQESSYGIIHLATHGEFNAGDLSKSYLHLHNEKLGLDQLRAIGLHRPAVELITLSACQTALGSRTAELGFAGFAVLAGAKTAVASLWNVSDQASAGLMIEFYKQLQGDQPTIKAEALRQAQLSMIRGDIAIAGDQLKLPAGSRQLPPGLALGEDKVQDFSHPYYWAAFSVIGSPW
ncbi:MAG: CHAT domain-containing protein [Cyanobacteria bacterium P01_A01_bin.137]